MSRNNQFAGGKARENITVNIILKKKKIPENYFPGLTTIKTALSHSKRFKKKRKTERGEE